MTPRATLLAKRDEIRSRRHEISIEQTPESLDQIAMIARNEDAARHIEADRLELRRINAALRRIDEGTYGICDSCSREIAPKRLAAVPSAELCLTCKELAERHLPQQVQRVVLEEV